MNRGPVLLIDIEKELAAQISQILAPMGFSTAQCAYGSDTARFIEVNQPPLLVVDLSRLPADGEVLCRQVAHMPARPLLLATIRREPGAAATALTRGATVCLEAPVEAAHLAAQAVVLLRLPVPRDQGDDVLVEVGGLTIDRRRCEVLVGGQLLPLTPTEFRILNCLARRPGRVIPPSEVAQEAVDLSLTDREAMELLKVHIYRLRQKLRAAGAPTHTLRNARGFGYLLERRAASPAPPARSQRLRRTA